MYVQAAHLDPCFRLLISLRLSSSCIPLLSPIFNHKENSKTNIHANPTVFYFFRPL